MRKNQSSLLLREFMSWQEAFRFRTKSYSWANQRFESWWHCWGQRDLPPGERTAGFGSAGKHFLASAGVWISEQWYRSSQWFKTRVFTEDKHEYNSNVLVTEVETSHPVYYSIYSSHLNMRRVDVTSIVFFGWDQLHSGIIIGKNVLEPISFCIFREACCWALPINQPFFKDSFIFCEYHSLV